MVYTSTTRVRCGCGPDVDGEHEAAHYGVHATDPLAERRPAPQRVVAHPPFQRGVSDKALGNDPAILIGCLAALASPCELGLDVGRRF